MKKTILALILVIGSVSVASASPQPNAELDVLKRNVLGSTTTLTLTNSGEAALELVGPWVIRDVRADEQVSHYDFSDDELTLEPGEQVVWDWMQDDACYGICRNVRAGEPVGAGVYESVLETAQGVRHSARFQLGQYFTLGFTSRPAVKFVVYVNTPDEVVQMEAEASTDDSDKQIVSGIVRRGRPYNSDWNFSMGSASIVLGDVFIEVCDGSPYYVQRHRREWLGERWCPWSSYVEKVGR